MLGFSHRNRKFSVGLFNYSSTTPPCHYSWADMKGCGLKHYQSEKSVLMYDFKKWVIILFRFWAPSPTIITGLNKLYEYMFSPWRWPQMPTGRKTPTQTQTQPSPPKKQKQKKKPTGHSPGTCLYRCNHVGVQLTTLQYRVRGSPISPTFHTDHSVPNTWPVVSLIVT